MMVIGRYGVRAAAAALLAAVCLAGASPAAAVSDGGRGPGLYPGVYSRRGGSSLDQRTIVIDPGHGGLDVGAKGKFGSVEKDVDLAISLKLKALIEQSQSYRVVLTRDKDLDVSLENRAAIANNNDALVFLSIHVNGSFRKKARGSETFFMSLNATDEESRKLAYQENREAALDKSIAGDEKDDIKMILWDMAQSAYIKQSSQLAELIQAQLNSLLGTENRGIKQADFVVLRGVACPAVLVEAAFISNPEEEQKLVDESFQNNVAQAVYTGLMRFLSVYGKN
jgi:N-acetylmuramoyl-L-alanine amidase